MDKILELKEIPGMGKLSIDDQAYIALLKKCHVPYMKVRQIYTDVPVKILRSVYNYPDVKVTDFNSELIGVSKDDYIRFLGVK